MCCLRTRCYSLTQTSTPTTLERRIHLAWTRYAALPTALMGKVLQSVVSVSPSFSTVILTNWPLILIPPPPIGEQIVVMSMSVCLSVCLCVCLCVFVYFRLSTIISSELHVRSSPIFYVNYGRGLVLLWWCSDALCTSGFIDDIIIADKPRLVDVAA